MEIDAQQYHTVCNLKQTKVYMLHSRCLHFGFFFFTAWHFSIGHSLLSKSHFLFFSISVIVYIILLSSQGFESAPPKSEGRLKILTWEDGCNISVVFAKKENRKVHLFNVYIWLFYFVLVLLTLVLFSSHCFVQHCCLCCLLISIFRCHVRADWRTYNATYVNSPIIWILKIFWKWKEKHILTILKNKNKINK